MTVARYFEAQGDDREAYLGSLTPEALLQLGIDLYNAGHYWNAHEAWEEVWLDSERDLRGFYQGLIQITAAFVHVTRNEYPGSVRLLDSGLEKLERYPATYQSVRLGPFLAGVRTTLAQLLALGEKRIADFDRALIPQLETEV